MSDKEKKAKEAEAQRKQASTDAHTLAQAGLISSDPDRLQRAKKAAADIIKGEKDKLNPMKKVARGAKVNKSTHSKIKKVKKEFNVFQKV